MVLKNAILEAIDLTQQLRVALGNDDLDLCRDLLDLRADAMHRFETAHQVANSQEHSVCSSYLRELFEEDCYLQDMTKNKFSKTRNEMRNNLGSSSRVYAGNYFTEPQNACLDRKA